MVMQNWFQQWSRKKNDLTDLSNTSAEIRKKISLRVSNVGKQRSPLIKVISCVSCQRGCKKSISGNLSQTQCISLLRPIALSITNFPSLMEDISIETSKVLTWLLKKELHSEFQKDFNTHRMHSSTNDYFLLSQNVTHYQNNLSMAPGTQKLQW